MVRINRISTRTGDTGTTGLADGRRVPKDHPRIRALGALDEANSLLGLIRCEALPRGLSTELARIQHDLFDLGADLAAPGKRRAKGGARLATAQVARLETRLAEAVSRLIPCSGFVLPAGNRAAALLHLARTVVRRVERELVAAMRAKPRQAMNPDCLRYLNRLSDLCFAWARCCNAYGRADVVWKPSKGAT
jgi:cob(I)alamin adenosyltransferase